MLPACFINPGDVTLMTVPGYPVAGTHTRYYGGVVYKLPLLAENDFLPDLDGDPGRRRPQGEAAGALLSQQPDRQDGDRPSSTSGRSRSRRSTRSSIVQDAAHGMLSFDRAPNSFLSVPGAKDVGVEVHSMSKGFDMIGWRIGWVCGNRADRAGVRRREGQQRLGPVHARSRRRPPRRSTIRRFPQRTRAKYQRRLEKLVATLARCGFKCQMPGGTYFLYTPSPKGFANGAGGGRSTSRTPRPRSQYLITEQSICTVPWDDAGPFLRFSVTYEAADEAAEDALMAETESRLKNLQPVF